MNVIHFYISCKIYLNNYRTKDYAKSTMCSILSVLIIQFVVNYQAIISDCVGLLFIRWIVIGTC